MYTGSEDGGIKIWDLRAKSCQRNYDVGSAVNTVALHPNQAELISGDMDGKIKVGSRQCAGLIFYQGFWRVGFENRGSGQPVRLQDRCTTLGFY